LYLNPGLEGAGLGGPLEKKYDQQLAGWKIKGKELKVWGRGES